MVKTNIFLSYCWNDSKKADKIYDYFKSSQNIELHRDTIDIGKWGSIKEYMQSISGMDYTILLISDSYLKSANCMYEVLEAMRDRNYKDKIFPAVIYSGIYSPITRAKYVRHWQDEFSELESTLKEINVQNLGKLNEDLKRRQDISSNIAEFLDVVSDMNNPNIEDVCLRIEEKLRQNSFLRKFSCPVFVTPPTMKKDAERLYHSNNQLGDKNSLIENSNCVKENIGSRESGRAESSCEIPIRNRAAEYTRKWNENVFLNNYNKRDENAGANIKLKSLYLDKHLPHYIWGKNDAQDIDIGELLKEYIVNIDDKKMLLVLGQPGIGKSTLITWIMANLTEKRDDIYVYQFGSDLKDIDWQKDNILKNIFERLNLKYNELEGKVLILDGFDEIHANANREVILNQIYHKLNGINYLKQFSLIITCRKNYIQEMQIRCDYITQQIWDEEQINSFCKTYANMSKCHISQDTINKLIENKEILGTPLILYMVLALDICVEENSSLVDIYDQIFSLNSGGIYDRCINNLSYDKEHRISKAKEQVHEISQRIAFWMFENNAEKAFIPQAEYERICDIVINEAEGKNENIKSDVFIGGYFELIKHCEGMETDELHFVHRSIYEYFVAVYFFESIHRLVNKKEIAGKLAELLKDGKLSDQILVFIKNKFDSMRRDDLADISKKIFNIMLKDGMTYYVGGAYKNIIERERNIFSNMLEVVRLWNLFLGKLDNRIVIYLQCNERSMLNLQGVDLQGANLNGANLDGANLIEANLKNTNLIRVNLLGANLDGANLNGANLDGVNLQEVNLNGADLSGANLSKADLFAANLDAANLSKANLSKADLGGVNLSGADLNGASLNGVNLLGANLSGADLNGADLSGASLNEANLLGANLSGADLNGANLIRASLNEANLLGANLSEPV